MLQEFGQSWQVFLSSDFRRAVLALAALLGDIVAPAQQQPQPIMGMPQQAPQMQPMTGGGGGQYAFYSSMQGTPMSYVGQINDMGAAPVMADGGGMGGVDVQQQPATLTTAGAPLKGATFVAAGPQAQATQYTIYEQAGGSPMMAGGSPMMAGGPAQMPGQMPGQMPMGTARVFDFASRVAQPLPEWQLASIAQKLREALAQIAGNPDFIRAIKMISETVLDLGNVPSEGGERGRRLMGKGIRSPHLLFRFEENRKAAMRDLMSIVQAFAGGYSIDGLIAYVDQAQLLYQSDWHYRDLMNDVGGAALPVVLSHALYHSSLLPPPPDHALSEPCHQPSELPLLRVVRPQGCRHGHAHPSNARLATSARQWASRRALWFVQRIP